MGATGETQPLEEGEGPGAETGVRRAGTQGGVGRSTEQMQASRGQVCQGEETERIQTHILKQQKELMHQ